MFEKLEAELSPHAKHAFETYSIAFTRGDPNMTVREMRDAITRLYGKDVDAELERHLAARRDAVLPKGQGVPPDVITLPNDFLR